jgi:hypothetical protein
VKCSRALFGRFEYSLSSVQPPPIIIQTRNNIVTYFKSIVSEVAFPTQPIWKFLGNRFVEAYIRCSARAKETELLETGVSFAVLP